MYAIVLRGSYADKQVGIIRHGNGPELLETLKVILPFSEFGMSLVATAEVLELGPPTSPMEEVVYETLDLANLIEQQLFQSYAAETFVHAELWNALSTNVKRMACEAAIVKADVALTHDRLATWQRDMIGRRREAARKALAQLLTDWYPPPAEGNKELPCTQS